MAGSWKPVADIRGRDGVGVPTGGSKGQYLKKAGDTDFATTWGKLNYSEVEGKVPPEALPPVGGQVFVPKSESEMLNLAAVPGATAIRSDLGKTFILAQTPPSTLANWVEMKTDQAVKSVAGKTGAVTLEKKDVGLDKVDNTADVDKPLATSATPGLMSKTDKALLDTAPTSTGFGPLLRQQTKNPAIASAGGGSSMSTPTDVGYAVGDMSQYFGAGYLDRSIVNYAYLNNIVTSGRIDGKGAIDTSTNWNNLKTSISGVVEGYPTGAPACRTVPGVLGPDEVEPDFKRPVWLLTVTALGGGYVKQQAVLLHCVIPSYVNGAGMTYERFYDAAASKWGAWSYTAGDTGDIRALESTSGEGDKSPMRIGTGAGGKAYGATKPSCSFRDGIVYIAGVMTSTSASALQGSDPDNGPTMFWFSRTTDSRYGIGLWTREVMMEAMRGTIQQGSGKDTWYLGNKSDNLSWGATRYNGNPGSNPWLKFSVSWPAPPVPTWGGDWIAGDSTVSYRG